MGCDLQPLLARQLVLLELNPPFPPDAVILPVPIGTPDYLSHGCIFAHHFLLFLLRQSSFNIYFLKLVAAFLRVSAPGICTTMGEGCGGGGATKRVAKS